MFLVERARERPLRRRFAQHRKPLRPEPLAPFAIAVTDREMRWLRDSRAARNDKPDSANSGGAD